DVVDVGAGVNAESRKKEIDNFDVSYIVSGGMTGGEIRLLMDQGGEFSISRKVSVGSNEDKKDGKMSTEKQEQLKEVITNARIDSWKSEYVCEERACPMDYENISVRIVVGENKKEINLYAPDNMPEDLSRLIDFIADFIEEK
ncbi:hypothetical protein ACFL16_03200, partial [Patescibacteria group bacterium]